MFPTDQNQVSATGAEQHDTELHSVKFDTDQKTFFLDLKESARGKYLKISEKRFGKKTTVIIPEEGIERLAQGIEEIKSKLN